MKRTHQKILTQLQREPLSIHALASRLHQSPDGIRGRVSELRKQLPDYTITLTNNKYHLQPTPTYFLKKLSEKNLLDSPIHFNQISTLFSIPRQCVEPFLINNFTKFHILQLSPQLIKIIP